MPSTATLLDDERLVPAARFGAALHRARTQSGANLAALARSSNGRFLPDHLVAVERGDVEVSDSDIRALASVYELADRPLALAPMLDVVLDRTPASGFATPGEPDRAPIAPDSWIAARFVALSVLLGADLTTGGFGVDVLAESLDSTIEATIALLTGVLEGDGARILAMIGAMEERVVVPEVGLLIGETAAGTLVLVGRSGTERPGAVTAACAPLAELLAVAV